MDRGARAEPPRAGLEPGRHPVRQRDPQPRDRRDRVRGGRGGGPPPGPDPRGARDRRRPPVRGSRLPGHGVVRDVDRRPGRCTSCRRARLGAAARHRGLGAGGAHGGDRDGGGVGDRRGGARAAPDRRRGGVARASVAHPRRGRDGRRPRPLGGRPGNRRARGEPRDGARLPRPARWAATIPARWADLAARWHAIGDPYREARARWRQAEAIMARCHRRTRGCARPDGRPPRARRRPRAADRRGDPRHAASAPGRSCAGCGSSRAARSSPLPPEVDTLLAQPARHRRSAPVPR